LLLQYKQPVKVVLLPFTTLAVCALVHPIGSKLQVEYCPNYKEDV
jgi:hypothetical protein